MRTLLSIFFAITSLNSIGQLNDSEIRNLKRGNNAGDSSYVYWLPYKKDSRYLFIQGANSNFSHKGELSFDFKMKTGSQVCAARGGIVTATKSDSDKGGLKPEHFDDGNHVIIQHEDGSIAQYWHLAFKGVLVNIGDTVKQGQLIGYSGNTGYSAFPHLHFQVNDQNGKEVLPRFQTSKGIIYLRPGRWYRNEKPR